MANTPSNRLFVEVLVVHDKSRYDQYGGAAGVPQMYQNGVDVLNAVALMYRNEIGSTGAGFDQDVVIVLVHTVVMIASG